MNSQRAFTSILLACLAAILLLSVVQANAPTDSAVVVPEPYLVLQKDPDRFVGPSQLIPSKKGIYFSASSAGEYGLWRSDGTDSGSRLIQNFGPTDDSGLGPFAYTPWAMAGSDLYFLTRNPQQLWRSDGTEAGTAKLSLPPKCADPYMVTAVGEDAYFFAEANGNWLCRSGDPAVKIKNLGANLEEDRTTGTLPGETILFFKLIQNFSWHVGVSDGTSAETISLYSPPGSLGAADGDTLYFGACVAWPLEGADCEPWKLDGVTASPERVKDIQAGYAGSNPYGFTMMNNLVYFTTNASGTDRLQLWKSDGTEKGTVFVADVGMCTHYPFAPVPTAQVNNRLFFPGNGGDGDCELWVTDGTEAGTFRVKDIWPGRFNRSYPESLTAAGDHVYYSAFEKEHGRELWRSDGTEQGTVLVKDIPGGSDIAGSGSMPNSLTVSEGRLFFSAGGELWAICLKDTPPAADFVAWPTDGPGPLQVGFENYSTCEFSTCSWDFGDGSTATGCADQKHTYIRTGTYSVKLTITGPGGTNSMILRNQITVFEAVAADFSAAPTTGPAPLEVTFKNQSSGDYNVCGWDFGDGTTATECADQTHTYAGTGKYTVKLSAKGPGGGDTMTKEQYILVETYRTFLPGVLGR